MRKEGTMDREGRYVSHFPYIENFQGPCESIFLYTCELLNFLLKSLL